MRLIYTKTGGPVQLGDVVQLDGEMHTIVSFRPPHKPSSSGKITLKAQGAQYESEYFVGIIGAKWVDREDQAAWAPQDRA